MERLLDEDQQDTDEAEEQHAHEEEQVEKKISLNEQRQNTVIAALKSAGQSACSIWVAVTATCSGGCWRKNNSRKSSL